MAKKVFTGWRNVEPGECDICGLGNEWSCDGRGNVYQLRFDKAVPIDHRLVGIVPMIEVPLVGATKTILW